MRFTFSLTFTISTRIEAVCMLNKASHTNSKKRFQTHRNRIALHALNVLESLQHIYTNKIFFNRDIGPIFFSLLSSINNLNTYRTVSHPNHKTSVTFLYLVYKSVCMYFPGCRPNRLSDLENLDTVGMVSVPRELRKMFNKKSDQ